jgi:hypothetical protein
VVTYPDAGAEGAAVDAWAARRTVAATRVMDVASAS